VPVVHIEILSQLLRIGVEPVNKLTQVLQTFRWYIVVIVRHGNTVSDAVFCWYQKNLIFDQATQNPALWPGF